MKLPVVTALMAGCFLALSATAALAETGAKPELDVSGDVRLRFEQDWDSHTSAGVERPERTRSRVRLRLNAAVKLDHGLTLHGRIRTGASGGQQYANITFADYDGNSVDELHFTADRFSIAWKGRQAGAELGRMAFPFFTPNEYFWDGDISPLGVSANYTLHVSPSARVKLIGGAFELPVALSESSGRLFAGQLVSSQGPASLAGGYFRFEADTGDTDRLRLLDGNGSRDYSILALNGQYRLAAAGKPLTLGVDYYRNLETYDDPADAIALANRNERTGYVVSTAWGDTADPGRFQLGYRYFHMEKFAVNASYAHDDVARFGTASQAALTDLQGHDLYANYALTRSVTIGVRAMKVERITNGEDGTRARLDLSYAF